MYPPRNLSRSPPRLGLGISIQWVGGLPSLEPEMAEIDDDFVRIAFSLALDA